MVKTHLFGQQRHVMAVINCTPDSFYKGSRLSTGDLLDICTDHINQGATILDIGGYSSRPGATEVSVSEELSRVLPVVSQVVKEFPEIWVSIDTFRSSVARDCVAAGAHLVNDITGGKGDPQMLDYIKESKTPYVLMHMRGTPQTMMGLCDYDDLVQDMKDEVAVRIQELQSAGVEVIFDPGLGFAKTLDQNYELLRRLEEFSSLDCPILIGASRKSMIYKLLGTTPEGSLNGTTVLNTIALLNGASILRVHDSLEASECLKLCQKTITA